jgi:hypothetical protein
MRTTAVENAKLKSEIGRLHNLLREALLQIEGAKMSVRSMSQGKLKALIRALSTAKAEPAD